MNKKTFVSITALTLVTGAVAGAVYYRHILVDQLTKAALRLDSMLDPQGQQVFLDNGDVTDDRL